METMIWLWWFLFCLAALPLLVLLGILVTAAFQVYSRHSRRRPYPHGRRIKHV